MSRLLAIALLACLGATAHGADLLAIYQEAVQRDAAYAAARAAREAGQEALPQGLAGLLPTARLTGSTQINDRELQLRNGGAATDQRFNSNVWGVTITQPLFRMQNWYGYEQGKLQVAVAEAQFVQATQDLIVRASQAYFDVLLAEFNVEVVQTQKRAIAEQLEQAKRNFEVGVATIVDTNEAQARYDLTVSQEITAINDLEVKKAALAQVIGRNPPPLAKLGTQFQPTPPSPNASDKWVEDAQIGALPVQIAQANYDIAGRQVSFNRAGHLPTIDAIASYTDQSSGAGITGGFGSNAKTSVLGLQLAVPLYQGGLVNSQVRQALANQEKARQDLENARRTAALNTRQSFLGVANGVASIRALEAAVRSSQSQLDSTRLAREVGIRTEVDVLNAQTQLSTARRDLAQAVYTYLLSTLKLKSAIGALGEDDIVAVNRWLDTNRPAK